MYHNHKKIKKNKKDSKFSDNSCLDNGIHAIYLGYD